MISNFGEDTLDQIWVTDFVDPSQSLDPAYIKAIDIPGGCAMVYDTPVDLNDFCFARFAWLPAWQLQVTIEQATFV